MNEQQRQQRSIIARRLKEERHRNGWTLQEVAERIGLKAHSTYGNWEHATRMPPHDKTVRLAEVYGVSVDYLLGRTNNRHSVLDADDLEFLERLELNTISDLLDRYHFTLDNQPVPRKQAAKALKLLKTFIESEMEDDETEPIPVIHPSDAISFTSIS